MALVTASTLPESVSTGKKGRPSLFTPAIQAEVAALPAGTYAAIQENVRGRSRVTTLRHEFQDFEFEGRATGVATYTKADGTEGTTDLVTIWSRAKVAAPEVVESVAEVTPDAAPSKPKARAAAKPKA